MTNPMQFEPVREAAEAYRLAIPEITLVAVACVLFVLAAVAPRKGLSFVVALAGILFAAAQALWYATDSPFAGMTLAQLYHSPFDPTGPASAVRWITLAGAALFCLLSYHETTRQTAGEYYGCLLVLAAGASLVGRANDLVTLYLALEMISIPTYVLLYLPVKTKAGQEAAMKYFLLSVLSSGVLLFGFSYFYGLTGTTNLRAVTDILTDAHRSGGLSHRWPSSPRYASPLASGSGSRRSRSTSTPRTCIREGRRGWWRYWRQCRRWPGSSPSPGCSGYSSPERTGCSIVRPTPPCHSCSGCWPPQV